MNLLKACGVTWFKYVSDDLLLAMQNGHLLGWSAKAALEVRLNSAEGEDESLDYSAEGEDES